MNIDVEVIGGDSVERYLRDFAKEADKVMVKTARTQARVWMKKVRAGLPHKEWGKLVKVKAQKRKDTLNLSAGLYGDKKAGKAITPYMKAYWMNYGTLEGRSLNHQFSQPVKKEIKRRNNTGQRARMFFEISTKGAAEDIVKSIEKALVEAADKHKDKN